MGLKKLFTIIILITTIIFIGCSNAGKSGDNPQIGTEYESSGEVLRKYKLEDFDHIVVGESTMCDLYKTVGVSPHFWYLNTKIIDVYPLDNGKYFFVTYINYQIEDKLDFTIDKIEVRDQNSIN